MEISWPHPQITDFWGLRRKREAWSGTDNPADSGKVAQAENWGQRHQHLVASSLTQDSSGRPTVTFQRERAGSILPAEVGCRASPGQNHRPPRRCIWGGTPPPPPRPWTTLPSSTHPTCKPLPLTSKQIPFVFG